MMLNAYSIFDLKAQQFHAPFYQSTDAQAARSLSEVVNDRSTLIGRHPSDFVLYCVGTFNDASGELQPISPRRHIADASAFVPLPTADLFNNGASFTRLDREQVPTVPAK